MVWLFAALLVFLIFAVESEAFFEYRRLAQAKPGTGLYSTIDESGVSKTSQRKSKQQKNRRKSMRSRSMGPLTEDDLRQHVNAQYIHGPNGIMRGIANKERHLSASDEHAQLLKALDRYPALVLNADYQPMSYLPLSMWHWQETIKAVFSGKVTVVDVYPDVHIRAASIEVALPSVIALNEYVAQPNTTPAFTKRNVFLRDEYRCQYCNHRFHTRDLSLDHVHPRSMGGQLNWENAVTSCRVCNGRKGSKLVSELKHIGMKLSREPFIPTQYQLHAIAGRLLPRTVHPTWAPYLGIEVPLNKGEKAVEAEMFFDDIDR